MLEETTKTMTALAPYGERDEVRALADRIMALHPSARAIGERGALLLAQLGVALGLNPLPGTGHIHAWVDKSGALCVHIGLEGRLALARKDSLYSFNSRPMRADEVDLHGLKPGDRGAVTELFRHDLTADMVRLGLPIKPMVGIGIAYAGELFPKGRSLAWRATQRSVKDAIRLAFSFSLPKGMPDVNFVEGEGRVPDEVLEGEFNVSDDARVDPEQRARDKSALYGEDETIPVVSPAPETPVPETLPPPEIVPVITPNPLAEAYQTGMQEAHAMAVTGLTELAEAVHEHTETGAESLPQTAKPNQKTATVANDVGAKWDAFCTEFAGLYPHYAAKDGQKPNKFHIGALAVKHGVGTVTSANLPALMGQMHKYAKENHSE